MTTRRPLRKRLKDIWSPSRCPEILVVGHTLFFTAREAIIAEGLSSHSTNIGSS